MAFKSKYRVHDMSSLRLEKQRLHALCEVQEYKLKIHASQLTSNYGKMAMNSFLPFKGETKDKVSNAMDLLNDTILPSILGTSFKGGGNDLTRNLLKVGQAVIISWSFRFFKKLLSKKLKPESSISE